MKFYRYKYKILSEDWDEIEIREYIFYLIRETPKGYWISAYGGKNKWIPKESKNRFAYPTREEAMFNFIKRMERHKSLLEARTNVAEMALEMAELKMSNISERSIN